MIEDGRTPHEELMRIVSAEGTPGREERRRLRVALREIESLRAMEDEVATLSVRMREDALDLLLRDAVLDDEVTVEAWLRGRGAMLPPQRAAARASEPMPDDDAALVASIARERDGVSEAMMQAGIDASPMFLCNDRGGRRIRTSFDTAQCREIYLAMRRAMTAPEVADEPAEAAARILWNDFHARYGGDFDGARGTAAHDQTVATARALLAAACVLPLDPGGPAGKATAFLFDALFPPGIDDGMLETFAEAASDAKAAAREENERRGLKAPHALADVQWVPQAYAAMRRARRDALFGRQSSPSFSAPM